MDVRHGGDWAGFQARYGRPPLDFSASLSPLGLPEGVRRAAQAALEEANRYPDPLCRALRTRLGEYHHLSPEYILCGNGAADLIFRLALAKKPKRALLLAPTFGEYEHALETVGCEMEHFFLEEKRDFQVTEALLERIVPGLDLLILCEPNNPTGQVTDHALLLDILERCAQTGTLLAVDECFLDFLPHPEEYSLMDEVPAHKNLLVFRAFTKCYAMAGLRLGYCLCADRALLENMARMGQAWGVSCVAQGAGLAALEEKAYLETLRDLMERERPLLQSGLEALGCRVIPGTANFLLFQSPVPNLKERLGEKGISIRSCRDFLGLGQGWYRVCVRTGEDNRRLLSAIREVR